MRFKHHIFVCENVRPEDDPKGCCAGKGSAAIRVALKQEIKQRGLRGIVRANQSGCLRCVRVRAIGRCVSRGSLVWRSNS